MLFKYPNKWQFKRGLGVERAPGTAMLVSVVTGKEQMSVFVPLNPKSKRQSLSCKPDGVARPCREAFATCFLSAPIEPHWPDQVTAFLRRLQTQIHSGTGMPQQLVPDRNTAAQNITTVSPWFNKKGAIYASFSPPRYCNYMSNLAFLLYIHGCFSAHTVKAGTLR